MIQGGVQESLLLDYKRCAALDKRNPKSRSDLSKDVSAFANSAGGTLIYGVEEENHLPKQIDAGFDPKDVTREWLEQVITSTIQRRIDGVRIKQIELKKNRPGRVAYVVHVPQSNRAPHMAEDHVFYKRYNFQSVPMEEYEIRDVGRRYDAPDLQLDFYLLNTQPTQLVEYDTESYLLPVAINGSLQNNSPTPAIYLVVRLYIDETLTVTEANGLSHNGQALRIINDHEILVHVLSLNWSTPSKMPIWEGVAFRFPDNPIQLATPGRDGTYHLEWEILSPSMLPRHGGYLLRVQRLGRSVAIASLEKQ